MKRDEAAQRGGRETADLSQLSPAARALVLGLVEAIAAAEARARYAEETAAADAPQGIAIDPDGETVLAKMMAAGEAQDRADAIAILVAEAVARRRSAPRRAKDPSNAAPPH